MARSRGPVSVDEVVPLAVSARAEVLADLVRVLTADPVHEVRNVGADEIVALRSARPGWATGLAWGLALPTLGLSLLLLRVSRRTSLSLRLLSGTQGVDLALQGAVEKSTLEALRGLRASVASRTPRRPAPMVAPPPVSGIVAAPVANRPIPPAPVLTPDLPPTAAPMAAPMAAPATRPSSGPAAGPVTGAREPIVLLPAPPPAADVDRTVLRGDVAARPAAPAPAPTPPPVVVLDTGQRVAVDGLVLVGRDPAPGPGEDGAALVRVDDPQRSVSKTHLSLQAADGVVWVVDRFSTNGVDLVEDGRVRRADAGTPTVLRDGVVVRFGDRRLHTERA